MRPVHPPPRAEVSSAIDLFLLRSVYPEVYAREIEPWERLVQRPTWRHAKGMMREGSGSEDRAHQVSRIVELVVGSMTGTRPTEALMCLGKVRQAVGSHEDAIPVFRQLADRGWPNNYMAYYNIGLCFVALGHTDKARRCFDLVLEIVPHDERAARALAGLS